MAGNDVWAPTAVEVFLRTELNVPRDGAGYSEVTFYIPWAEMILENHKRHQHFGSLDVQMNSTGHQAQRLDFETEFREMPASCLKGDVMMEREQGIPISVPRCLQRSAPPTPETPPGFTGGTGRSG